MDPVPISFEQALKELKEYEVEHEERLMNTWSQMENFNMRGYIQGRIEHSSALTQLMEQGTTEEMTTFYEKLRETVPLIAIDVLMGLLDSCNRAEKLQHTFSKDVVKWFRKMGWKFPDFEFEKIESAALQQIVSTQ